MHNLEDDRRGTTVPFFYRALGKQLRMQYHAIYIYIYIYIRDFYRVLGNNYWLPRGAKHYIYILPSTL